MNCLCHRRPGTIRSDLRLEAMRLSSVSSYIPACPNRGDVRRTFFMLPVLVILVEPSLFHVNEYRAKCFICTMRFSIGSIKLN